MVSSEAHRVAAAAAEAKSAPTLPRLNRREGFTKRTSAQSVGVRLRNGGTRVELRRFVNVWDPGEHPEKRQQPERGAAGRHERPELDAGGRRAGRQHSRPKVSSARIRHLHPASFAFRRMEARVRFLREDAQELSRELLSGEKSLDLTADIIWGN